MEIQQKKTHEYYLDNLDANLKNENWSEALIGLRVNFFYLMTNTWIILDWDEEWVREKTNAINYIAENLYKIFENKDSLSVDDLKVMYMLAVSIYDFKFNKLLHYVSSLNNFNLMTMLDACGANGWSNLMRGVELDKLKAELDSYRRRYIRY